MWNRFCMSKQLLFSLIRHKWNLEENCRKESQTLVKPDSSAAIMKMKGIYEFVIDRNDIIEL